MAMVQTNNQIVGLNKWDQSFTNYHTSHHLLPAATSECYPRPIWFTAPLEIQSFQVRNHRIRMPPNI